MDREEFFKRLGKNRKPITLFIGSSINPPSVPLWGRLVNNLLDSAVRRLLTDFSYSDRVEDIREWIKKNYSVYEQGNFIVNGLGTDYIGLVYNTLFGEFTQEHFDDTDTNLHHIAKICLSPKINSVVTYNYDDLLEEKIKSLEGRRVVSQYGKKLRSVFNRQLPVYHVHGYLPWKTISLADMENDIVLGLEEYHRQYYEQSSWQSTTPLHLMESNFCIFLCTSLTDVDMLTLRSFSHQYSRNRDIYYVSTIDTEKQLECESCGKFRRVEADLRAEISRINFHYLNIRQVTVFRTGNDYVPFTGFLKEIWDKLTTK